MRDGDMLALALLLWAWTRGGERARPGSPALPPGPSTPRANIGEGWWWYWFPTSDAAAYQAVVDKEQRRSVRRKTRRRWEVRKTIGGTAMGATVVVFYVFEPFKWALPGLPERAPRGIDTDLTDVAWAIPQAPTELQRMAQAVANATWEYLRELYLGQRPPSEPLQ